MVKLGLTNIPTYPGSADPVRALEDQLDRVRLARDLGFASVWVTHHILGAPYQYFQALPMLARIAAESGPMTVGTCVLLLPYFHPVPLAEDLATIDIISNGRLILGVGLGGNAREFAALGLNLRSRVGRFTESLDLMQQLWSGDPVTYRGKHFQVEGAQLGLRTIQRPRLRIWIGGGVEAAIRRAARLGDVWVSSPGPVALVRDRWATYRRARADRGRDLPEERPARVDVFLAETSRRALEDARPSLEEAYGRPDASAGVSYEDWVREWAIVGDPDDCLKRLAEYQAFGVNHFVARVYFPGSDPAFARRTVEILGRQVLPALA